MFRKRIQAIVRKSLVGQGDWLTGKMTTLQKGMDVRVSRIESKLDDLAAKLDDATSLAPVSYDGYSIFPGMTLWCEAVSREWQGKAVVKAIVVPDGPEVMPFLITVVPVDESGKAIHAEITLATGQCFAKLSNAFVHVFDDKVDQ